MGAAEKRIGLQVDKALTSLYRLGLGLGRRCLGCSQRAKLS